MSERRKSVLIPAATRSLKAFANFNFGSDPLVAGNDLTPHPEVDIDAGYVARARAASFNVVKPGTGNVIIDIKYSIDPFDMAYAARTWTSIFGDPDGGGPVLHGLLLPVGQMRLEQRVTIFSADPLDLPPLTLLRGDIISASGASVGLVIVEFDVVRSGTAG